MDTKDPGSISGHCLSYRTRHKAEVVGMEERVGVKVRSEASRAQLWELAVYMRACAHTLYTCVHAHACACVGICVEIKGQSAGVGSLLLPHNP